MEKISRLAAGTIRVMCDIKNDRINTVEIHGDFFASEELEQLCESLTGCSYDRMQVYEVLSAKNSDNIIYGVSKEELLEAMF